MLYTMGKSKSILGKIHEYLTLWLFFILPIEDKLLPLSIVLWAVSWLLWRLTKPTAVIKLRKVQVIGTFVFLGTIIWGFISVLLLEDASGSLIERRLLFILVPMVLLVGESSSISRIKINNALLLGCISAIIFFSLSTLENYFISSRSVFHFRYSFHYFQWVIAQHKHIAYFSILAIISFYRYVSANTFSSNKDKLIALSVYLLFFAYITLMRSRIGLINYVLMTIILVCTKLLQHIRLRKLIIIGIPFILMFIVSVVYNPKFKEILNSQDAQTPFHREVLWQSAVNLIKDRPVLGYGLGGAEKILTQEAQDNGIALAVQRNLNAHNQYLQSILDNGLFILIVFIIATFLMLDRSTSNKKDHYVFLFLAIALLTESMFQRIAGIAIFGLILYSSSIPAKRDEIISNKFHPYVFAFVLLALLLLSCSLFCIKYDKSDVIESNNASTFKVENTLVLDKDKIPSPLPSELLHKKFTALKLDAAFEGLIKPSGAFMRVPLAYSDVLQGDSVNLSTYCYISDDFEVDWTRVSIDGENAGKSRDIYDLSRKGQWQKLSVSSICSKGNISLNLYFSKLKDSTLGNTDGYIIFATPSYSIYRNGELIKSSK